jgi:hypothetical protein
MFGLWHRVVFEVANRVSEVHTASIFRVEMIHIQPGNYNLYEDSYFSKKLERRCGIEGYNFAKLVLKNFDLFCTNIHMYITIGTKRCSIYTYEWADKRTKGKLITYFPLIRYGLHRKRPIVACSFVAPGNVFIESCPATIGGQRDWWEGFMKDVVEMSSDVMLYIWGIIKIGSDIQMLTGANTQTT